MNFILLPSLQEAAAVRTASLLYNDHGVEIILMRESDSLRQREQLEMWTEKNLFSLLSSTVRKSVAEVIRLMQDEVGKWKKDRKLLLKYIGGCFRTCLCWKTDGTINRTETAKKLVVNDHIDPKIRFIIACTYFLEEEVASLWERYEEIEKDDGILLDTNIAVGFWVECLKKKDTRHWSEMIDGYLRNRRSALWHIPVRISCFYHLLSTESKQNIYAPLYSKTHVDDFQVLVNKMNETERIKLFRSKSLIVLLLCLKWPFRAVFIRVAKEAIGYLDPLEFVILLQDMLNGYIRHTYEDFHLFETFWQMCSIEMKGAAKTMDFIITLRDKCSQNKNIPPYFKEILRKCLD